MIQKIEKMVVLNWPQNSTMKKLASLLSFILISVGQLSAQAGFLDSDFGSDGTASFEFPGGSFSVFEVKLQSDDKILCFGKLFDNQENQNFPAVARVTADGSSLDFSFGENGISVLETPAFLPDFRFDMAVNDADEIFLLSDVGPNATVTKLTPNGQIDTDFAVDGDRELTFTDETILPADITLDENGNLFIAAETNNNFGVIKLNANGDYDTSFGDNGRAVHSLNGPDQPYGITVQEDGKVLVCGTTDDGFGLWIGMIRIEANGELDSGFGDNGEVIRIVNGSDYPYAVEVDSQGRIVLGGRIGGGQLFATGFIARYTSDGSEDLSFGDEGFTEIEIPLTASWFWDIKIQPDDKILATGRHGPNGGETNFLVSRINEDGSPDGDWGFEGTGSVIVSLEGTELEGLSINLDQNGDAIIGGSPFGFDSFQLAKIRTDLNLGAENETEIQKLKVFPNPAKEEVRLVLGSELDQEGSMSVFDLQGRLVYQENIRNSATELRLDISQLPSGLYQGLVRSEDSVRSFSFMKAE